MGSPSILTPFRLIFAKRQLPPGEQRLEALERSDAEREAAIRAFEEEALRAQAGLQAALDAARARQRDSEAAAAAARAEAARAVPPELAAQVQRANDRLAGARAGDPYGSAGGAVSGVELGGHTAGASAQAHQVCLLFLFLSPYFPHVPALACGKISVMLLRPFPSKPPPS